MSEPRKRRDHDEDLEAVVKVKLMEKYKTLLFVGALAFTLILSVGLSIGATLILMPAEQTGNLAEEELIKVQADLLEIQNQLADYNVKLQAIEDKSAVLHTYLRHSSSTTMKNILIDQEQNIQKFLISLNAGVRDLSAMVGGSTDWQQDYSQQIDTAVQHSAKRVQLLSLLKTGDPETQNKP